MQKTSYLYRFFGHLSTVLTHKWWVFYYACKVGIPWQGLWHDMSKFSPVEFFEGVKYYTGTSSPINACKAANGGLSKAWLHHSGRNKHHWEYWYDVTQHKANYIPVKFIKEMLCDYLAAGRTYDKYSFSYQKEAEWWQNQLWYRKIDIERHSASILSGFFNLLETFGEEGFDIIKTIV